MKVLITGSGGFIGGHLAKRLVEDGFDVRCTDIKAKERWWQVEPEADNRAGRDLCIKANCIEVCQGMARVFHLAANMGGIGHITQKHAECAMDNIEIDTAMLRAAKQEGVGRFLFSSSACVYRQDQQDRADVAPLKEEDAWPADPEPGYGLEKLYAEQLYLYAKEDYGLDVRVPRLHNVYGKLGDWRGGKEKAPAAICRKVAEAVLAGKGHIDVWGDGQQTRSFMYVDDCVEGLLKLMESDFTEPINLGSSEMVTINQLIDLVERIAGVRLERCYDTSKPQGVRGRCSDNSLIQLHFGWQPTTPLATGLRVTYEWIEQQVRSTT